MEQGVDAVTAIGLDGVAVPALGELLDDGAVVLESGAGLCNGDGRVETVAGGFDYADGFWVGQGFVADVVGLVDVAVEAVVVEGHVDVDNVAVDKGTLIGDTVADGLVDASADGLGEVVVVEWGGV